MSIEPENYSVVAWMIRHKIKGETGQLIDVYSKKNTHRFLIDIYEDWSPKLVCYKAAQIGFTTLATLKSFWVAKHRKLDIIYTNPSDADSNQFVSGKVQRIIAQNPILQTYVKDKDSVSQKSVGESLIYYKGTWGERAAISVSSDLNIYDEEDRSKQEIIQMYASRLQHSKYKWEWHFSNPSVEGNGVSRYWARSDQKHWFVRCRGCARLQYLSFPESIDPITEKYICKHCHHEITDEDRRTGEWVAKYENREFSGYWINLMIAPWVSAKDVLDYKETKSAEYFSNFVLGLPYVGEGNQVTPDIIYRNCTPDINTQEQVVIGCDSGIKKHFVLGNRDGLFYYGVTKSWDDIRALLKRYPRSIAVIDALPDITEPRKLRDEFKGRVFLCHYVRDRKTMGMIQWGKKDELGVVRVDRNRALQMLIDEFADKRIPLQGTQDDWAEYYSHWDTLYKLSEVKEDDPIKELKFRWESSNGNDHWCHATLYWRAGMDRFRNEGGKIFDTTEFIKTTPEIAVDGALPARKFVFPDPDIQHDWRKTV